MAQELTTYNSALAYRYFCKGYSVYVAHSEDECEDVPMLSASDIEDAEGHLFVIKSEDHLFTTKMETAQ